MSPPLFWVGSVPPAGEIATVDGDEGRHAVTVTRVSPGERIIVADGLGTSGLAEVTRWLPRTVVKAARKVSRVTPWLVRTRPAALVDPSSERAITRCSTDT